MTLPTYHLLPVPPTFICHVRLDHSKLLWIGCSDSLVSETDTVSIPREDIFVHRDLGNIVSNGDSSSASAIEWGLGLLKVDHIIICGHYDCSLLQPHPDPTSEHLPTSCQTITFLHTRNASQLPSTLFPKDRDRKLEELHVLSEVQWLRNQPAVRKAMQERGMKVHGFVFDRNGDGGKGVCVRVVEGEEGEAGVWGV